MANTATTHVPQTTLHIIPISCTNIRTITKQLSHTDAPVPIASSSCVAACVNVCYWKIAMCEVRNAQRTARARWFFVFVCMNLCVCINWRMRNIVSRIVASGLLLNLMNRTTTDNIGVPNKSETAAGEWCEYIARRDASVPFVADVVIFGGAGEYLIACCIAVYVVTSSLCISFERKLCVSHPTSCIQTLLARVSNTIR